MRARRRLENAALILPIFGAVLIVPPLIAVFNAPALVFGVPLAAVYLFAVWGLLIGLTAALGPRLLLQDREPQARPPQNRMPLRGAVEPDEAE